MTVGAGDIGAGRQSSRQPLEERRLRRADRRGDRTQRLHFLDQPGRATVPPRHRRRHQIKSRSSQPGSGAAAGAWGPGEHQRVGRGGAQAFDQAAPHGGRHAVRLDGTEPGYAGATQAREPVGPPVGEGLGGVGRAEARRGGVRPRRGAARIGRAAAKAGAEPAGRALPHRGVRRHLVQHQVQHQPQAMLRCMPCDVGNPGVGGAVPAQCRMQCLMIGGHVNIAAGVRGEGRRDADMVESHRADAREHRRPGGKRAGDQWMHMIDLCRHSVLPLALLPLALRPSSSDRAVPDPKRERSGLSCLPLFVSDAEGEAAKARQRALSLRHLAHDPPHANLRPLITCPGAPGRAPVVVPPGAPRGNSPVGARGRIVPRPLSADDATALHCRIAELEYHGGILVGNPVLESRRAAAVSCALTKLRGGAR